MTYHQLPQHWKKRFSGGEYLRRQRLLNNFRQMKPKEREVAGFLGFMKRMLGLK